MLSLTTKLIFSFKLISLATTVCDILMYVLPVKKLGGTDIEYTHFSSRQLLNDKCGEVQSTEFLHVLYIYTPSIG